MKKITLMLGLALLILISVSCGEDSQWKDNPMVTISTSMGDIKLVLYNDTPQHRDNFLKLAKEGYYDGTTFHRVIKDFMIQGGDPNSKSAETMAMVGNGGPGYTIPAEFNINHLHVKGTLCAARQGDQMNPKRESSGSQFYIVQGKIPTVDELNQIEQHIQRQADPQFKYTEEQKNTYLLKGGTPFLDLQYTVFGEVVEGLEVMEKIAALKTLPGDRPVEDIKIKVVVD